MHAQSYIIQFFISQYFKFATILVSFPALFIVGNAFQMYVKFVLTEEHNNFQCSHFNIELHILEPTKVNGLSAFCYDCIVGSLNSMGIEGF